MIRLNEKRFDPQSHLEKHGWQKGSGLGRGENGIKEAIKVKIKNDTTGVGHDPGKEFSFHWWDHVFNKAANSFQVHNTEEGVRVTQVPAKSKKAKKKATKNLLYGNFIKASTLTCDAHGIVETKLEKESSDSDDDIAHNMSRCTDEELFKLCGSRTAHKGARHGLKLGGKLQRLEEQDRLATESVSTSEQSAVISHHRKKKRKKRKGVNKNIYKWSTKGNQDDINELHIQKDKSGSGSKKHRKRNAADTVEESEPVLHSSKRNKKRKELKE